MKKSLLSVLVVGLVALTPAFAFAATFQDNVFKEVSDFADALSRASQGIGATAIQAVNNLTELGKTFDQVRSNSSTLVISPILNVTGSSTTNTNGCAPGAYYNSLTGKPCATATTTPTTGPCINLTVTLNRGMTDAKTNNQVSILQKYLMAQGYLSVTAATGLGSYGPATAAAVRRFEQANGLPVNGVVTPQTRAKIKQRTCGKVSLPLLTPLLQPNATSTPTSGTSTLSNGLSVSNATASFTPVISSNGSVSSGTMTFSFIITNTNTTDVSIMKDSSVTLATSTVGSVIGVKGMLTYVSASPTTVAGDTVYSYDIPAGGSRTITYSGSLSNTGQAGLAVFKILSMNLTDAGGKTSITSGLDNLVITTSLDGASSAPTGSVKVGNNAMTIGGISVGNTVPKASVNFWFTITNTTNSDIFIDRNSANTLTFNNVGVSPSITNAFVSGLTLTTSPGSLSSDIIGTSTQYAVPAGSSRTFTYNGTLDNSTGIAGTVTIQVTGITYTTSGGNKTGGTITSGLDSLKLSYRLDGAPNSGSTSGAPTTPNKTLAGDINGDAKTDIFDYNLFSPSYNSKVGSTLYNPNADFNGDGSVDIFDLNMLLANYNKSVTVTGDINHDGIVNLADSNLLSQYFGSSLGQTNYNPDADLNHDGQVSLADFNILQTAMSGSTNTVAAVSARLSPSSPATRTVTTSATQSTPNVVLGVFGLNAANNSAKITGLNFNVSNSSIYSNLRLVDGSTVYGSNNGYGGFSNLSIALTQNQWKDLTLMADVNAGVNGVVASSTLFANSSNIIGTSGTSSSSPITVSSGAYVANPITFSANGVTASNLMAFTTPQTVNNVTVKYTATFEVTLSNTSNSDIFVSNNPSIALDTSSTGAFGTSTSASINLITTNPYFIAADTNTVLAVPAGTSRIFTFSGPVVSAPGTSLQFKILQINYGTSAATPIGSSITGLTPLSVNVSF